jgi:hypothetical protein
MMNLLAEVGGGLGAGDMVSLGALGTFLAGIGSFVLTLVKRDKIKEEGRKEIAVTLPQPFEMRMKEEFVTRREFERLEANMAGNIAEMKGMLNGSTAEMKGLFRETMSAVSVQNTSLTQKMERQYKSMSEEIGKVASAAHAGRQKIWEIVNDQREEVAMMKVNSDVAGQIGKLAEAIAPTTIKVQPTHPSHS